MSTSILPANEPQELHELVNQYVAGLDAIPLDKISILPRGDKPAVKDILPVLAAMFEVDTTGMEESAGRELIEKGLLIHRYKGTPWSLKQVLQARYGDVGVEEFFLYGGQEYCFKIAANRPIQDQATYDGIVATTLKDKNVRSHLDAVQIKSESQGPVHIGGLVGQGKTLNLGPKIEIKTNPGAQYAGGAVFTGRTTTIGPPRVECVPDSAQFIFCGAVHTGRITTIRNERLING